MKCPRCGALYRDGFTRCADCGARLRRTLPGADGGGAQPMDPRPLALPPGETDPACAYLAGRGVRLWRRAAGDGTFRRVYLGFSSYKDKFYVDVREYPHALMMLETYALLTGGAPPEHTRAKRRRRRAVRVLAAALALLLVLALLAVRLPVILRG